MYYNGWGNICDDNYYNSAEANVICHQLGYTGASSYYRAGLVRCVIIEHLKQIIMLIVTVQITFQWSWMMLTVLVVHTCLLLNAPTLLILIVGVLIVTVMMLLSTAVRL